MRKIEDDAALRRIHVFIPNDVKLYPSNVYSQGNCQFDNQLFTSRREVLNLLLIYLIQLLAQKRNMTSPRVFAKYEHVLEKQINRSKKEFVENKVYDPNCPVCKGNERVLCKFNMQKFLKRCAHLFGLPTFILLTQRI